MATPLCFGVIELDKLLSRRRTDDAALPGVDTRIAEFGIDVQDGERTSVCVLGPDGCGKSILALHLASYYRAKTHNKKLQVIYFSTDFSYMRAFRTWKDFGLSRPKDRLRWLPRFAKSARYEEQSASFPDNIKLEDLKPLEPSILEFLGQNALAEPAVLFIDSETQTTGDDWLYLQRLVSVLPTPQLRADKKPDDPHLLVIDAVEGLEPVPGGPDSYGDIRTGRTRIAQLIRAAKGKCHIVYVVEEPKANERLDTQYVTDVVIRLRTVTTGTYSRRSIEIEKARGHQHVRGQHDIVIRKGNGTTTGRDPNPDDPRVPANESDNGGDSLAYVHILRSVHALSRELLERKSGENPQVNPDQQEVFGFGIHYLDRLLPKVEAGSDSEYAKLCESLSRTLNPNTHPPFFVRGIKSEKSGLIGSTVNALIGPLTTYKSRLGRSFLAHALAPCLERILKAKTEELDKLTTDELDPGGGIAVLITTLPMDSSVLFRECLVHLGMGKDWIDKLQKLSGNCDGKKAIWKYITNERIICRRLEVHHLTAEGAIHVVTCAVRAAQEKVLQEEMFKKVASENDNSDEIRIACRRIRLVIDDWSLIKKAYPDASEDHLLLPYFVQLFKREGITTLFIDTEAGLPLSPSVDADAQLRTLTSHHIYTWGVPFAGERRVAITCAPPNSASLPSTTYELRPLLLAKRSRDDSFHNERLVVDPHFEMYSGMDLQGKVERVPLRVKLYGQADSYFKGMKELMGQLFEPVGSEDVVTVVDPDGYDLMKDYAYLQDNVRLEHTLVMQVDEFWSETHQSLYNLTDYMKATVRDVPEPALQKDARDNQDSGVQEIEDPYRLHQSQDFGDEEWRARLEECGSIQRLLSFSTYKESNDYLKYEKLSVPIDKVPYLWDFGFLLANRKAWLAAAKACPGALFEVVSDDDSSMKVKVTVQAVWRAMTTFRMGSGRHQDGHLPSGKIVDAQDPRNSATVTWPFFFEVCKRITPAGACHFDVDLRTIEVISCLVLEVWLSFAFKRIRQNNIDEKPWKDFKSEFVQTFSPIRHVDSNGSSTLLKIVEYPCMARDLFYALCLVFQHVRNLNTHNFDFCLRAAQKDATAARHFYSTACDPHFNDGSLVPMRLPGNFSVRGDWFLALGKGSRSTRLGERAMDLLCSTRSNLTRLQEGIGLPVRTIIKGSLRTALAAPWRANLTPNLHIDKVMYEQLLKLAPNSDNKDFQFLWRSIIRSYDLHSRAWLRWIGRVWQVRNAWLTELQFDTVAKMDLSSIGPGTLAPEEEKHEALNKAALKFELHGTSHLKHVLSRLSNSRF